MVLLSLRLGRRLSRCALYGITLYFFLFAADTRRYSLRYLRLALGRSPNARDRFRHLLYFATCIHDRVYLIDAQYDASTSRSRANRSYARNWTQVMERS